MGQKKPKEDNFAMTTIKRSAHFGHKAMGRARVVYQRSQIKPTPIWIPVINSKLPYSKNV